MFINYTHLKTIYPGHPHSPHVLRKVSVASSKPPSTKATLECARDSINGASMEFNPPKWAIECDEP